MREGRVYPSCAPVLSYIFPSACYAGWAIFNFVLHLSRAVVFGAQATTAHLYPSYPGRDTLEFDQRHLTNKRPITMLVLMSESPGI